MYLLYATKDKSIKCINLNKQQVIVDIKNAHLKFITNFKHCYDENKKIDIIMSVASDDNEIKLWNFYDWECFLHLKNINKSGNILSACFLKEKDNIFIITSNFEIFDSPEGIKVFDIKGNFIKDIRNSRGNTFYIEVYFDKIKLINYIITCNLNLVKSYDFNKNIEYHKYYEKKNSFHNSFEIICCDNNVKLIDCCNDGIIRIWDFHLNVLLNTIKVDNNGLISICIWDEKNILVVCKNKGIKLIEIIEGKIKKIFKIKNNNVYTIKLLDHPKYGKSIITQGLFLEQIKLWIK